MHFSPTTSSHFLFPLFSDYSSLVLLGVAARSAGLLEGWLPMRCAGKRPRGPHERIDPQNSAVCSHTDTERRHGGFDFNNMLYLPSTSEMLSLDVKLLMRISVLFCFSCDVVGTSLSSCEAVASILLALCGSWQRGRLSRMPTSLKCPVLCPHPRFKA